MKSGVSVLSGQDQQPTLRAFCVTRWRSNINTKGAPRWLRLRRALYVENKMPRKDISRDLVHWVKAETDEEAFHVLRKIVSEKRILGGSGHIKGDYVCVCFTEAPLNTFHDVIGRYRPFGIRVSKNFAYEQGGRPVIYQSDAEYDQLPESMRWRHVRYEPNSMSPIDFSWEREWRINLEELVLPPGQASVIVPCESWADHLSQEHLVEQESRIQLEAMAYGEEWLMQTPDPFYYPLCVVHV